MRDRRTLTSSTASTSDDGAGLPGKVSRTAAIQRRARPAAQAPEPASTSAPPHLGGPADPAHDDPFGLHLDRARPVQARLAMTPATDAAVPEPTGAGAPLPDGLRASMEASFGTELGGVRVHEGGNAAALGAVAYAQGEDLHFQPGAYDPSSISGRELIGHELAHVVQQREGRVAVPQGKGAPINADPALEAEADAQGARAARGEPAGNAAGATRALAAGGAVQRKVVFDGHDDATTDQIHQALADLGVLGDAEVIYNQVLRGKPHAMVQKPELKFLDVEDVAFQKQIIEAWRVGPGTHTYQRSKADGERLFEHALTHHLHTKHDWRNIGVAEYMTGDATALALAPLVDPNLTVEILTGQQKKGETQGPTFLGREGELPPYFSGAQQGGHIVFSDTNNRDDFKGTSDRYGKTFNPHVNPNVLPWDKETWEATDVLGKAFQDPDKRDLVRSKLQLGSSEGDEATKRQIETFKQTKLDPQLAGRPCVFLWGRTSGKKGGAHKELDSHAEMLVQLALKIRADFPGHMLILVGDPVITLEDLQQAGIDNQVMNLGPFWEDPDFGRHMKDRNAQRYLFQLFDQQNQAVSIGMRSGSLEGMALLGLRVVFLDDQGNNAEGRMELWSGDGAHDRGRLVREGANSDTLDQHERDHQGSMPTYKRVGTLLTLGNQVDLRDEILGRGRTLVDELLSGNDHAGQPMCSDEGNPRGRGILVASFGDKYDANLMAGVMPTDPVPARSFASDLDTFVNLVTSGNYKGKPAEDKGSQFGTGSGDVDTMEAALRRDLGEDPDGQRALEALAELRGLTDVTAVALVGENDTSKVAEGLFGSLLTKSREGAALTKEDAQAFVKRLQQRRGGLLGKSTPAQPGIIKFPRPRVTGVKTGIDTLERSNILQPDELDQVSHLTRFLTEQQT